MENFWHQYNQQKELIVMVMVMDDSRNRENWLIGQFIGNNFPVRVGSEIGGDTDQEIAIVVGIIINI